MEQTAQPQPKQKKTIYDVGYGSIFFRNFLAGFSRTFGAITVYLLLGGLIYYMLLNYLLPQLKDMLPNISPFLGPPNQQFPNSSQNIEQPGYAVTQEQLDSALELLQKEKSITPPPPQQSH